MNQLSKDLSDFYSLSPYSPTFQRSAWATSLYSLWPQLPTSTKSHLAERVITLVDPCRLSGYSGLKGKATTEYTSWQERDRAIVRWNVINIWREIESNRTGNGLLTSLPASIINQLFLILNNLVPHPQTFSCIYIEKSVCSGGRSFEPLVMKLSVNVQEFFNERFNASRTKADFPIYCISYIALPCSPGLYPLHRVFLVPQNIPFTSYLL